jgi:LacI family transcriptional regulator
LKNVTILDIAKELNTTFSTVSRALRNHPGISKSMKAAIQLKAREMGYRTNSIASALRSGKTNVIGVLVPRLDVSFFSSVVHGIEKVLNERNYTLLLFQSQESFEQECKGLDTFMSARVAGILASVSLKTQTADSFKEIVDQQIPLAFFDRVLPLQEVPSVTNDDFQGGFLATQHLIESGYKRIVHINQADRMEVFEKRYQGYCAALEQYGIPLDNKLIKTGDFSLAFGQQCIRELMKDGVSFDAVFTLEDYTAMGVVQELRSANIQVPQDVGVVGFANEAFTQLVTPTLSTVDQHAESMGIEVATMFLDRLEKGQYYQSEAQHIVLQPELLVRDSSKIQRQKCAID